jgi:hypothetical protein
MADYFEEDEANDPTYGRFAQAFRFTEDIVGEATSSDYETEGVDPDGSSNLWSDSSAIL